MSVGVCVRARACVHVYASRVCVYVRACVRVTCMRVCVCTCMRVCVFCVHVHAYMCAYNKSVCAVPVGSATSAEAVALQRSLAALVRALNLVRVFYPCSSRQCDQARPHKPRERKKDRAGRATGHRSLCRELHVYRVFALDNVAGGGGLHCGSHLWIHKSYMC